MKIIDGDIFDSNADAIVHQVNCQGVMGAGVARQVRDKYPNVYVEYRALCDRYRNNTAALLGYVLGIECGNVFILNCFAQDGYGAGGCYTDYDALAECFQTINGAFRGKRIAIPYQIGCGLGGGDWNVVSDIIETELSDCDITLYRLK